MNVPLPGTLCTGDTISTDMVSFLFQCPSDLWIQEAVYGLLYDYAQTNAWTQCGLITIDQATEVFTNLWESLTLVSDIGSVDDFATLALPANYLPCDGSSYLRTDYPQLFAAIGTLWGSVDSTHFNVPDFRGRVRVSSGTGSGLSPRTITDVGGEEDHQLTVSELASRAHALQEYPLGGTSVPPPFDSVAATPHIINSTGSTGGDVAHNTMQPFVVVQTGIKFK